MQLRMGDFVNGGLNRLQLTHTLFDSNSLIGQTEISVCAVCDLLKSNRNGGRFFKGGEKILVLLHIGKQRFNGKVGKLLALGLRNIKDGYNLKGGDGDFLFFLYHFSLAVKHGLSRFGVDFINQLFHLVGRGGKDFNAFLAFLYMAVKLLFPLTEAHYQIAALHSN